MINPLVIQSNPEHVWNMFVVVSRIPIYPDLDSLRY